MDTDSAIALYRSALDANPRSFSAHARLHKLLSARMSASERRREYASLAASRDPVQQCIAQAAGVAAGTGQGARARFDAIVRAAGHNVCTRGMIGSLAFVSVPSRDSAESADRLLRAALEDEPGLGWLWLVRATGYEYVGDASRAEAVLREALRKVDHPVERVNLGVSLYRVLLRRNSAGAAALLREIEGTVRRDGRPGVRHAYLQQLQALATGSEAERFGLSAIAIARAHGDMVAVANGYAVLGATQIDGGDPASAIDLVSRGAFIADSIDARAPRVGAHLRLGRAYVKAGRLAEARRELMLARTLADSAERHTVAEIEHNLAHLYESMGDLASAAQAVDRFAEVADALHGEAIRVMAYRDAGVIHSKAGKPERARQAFEAMVRRIDQQRGNWTWAGEYYERTGDLRRALSYYRRVPANDQSEGARALAGVTRIYEALGMTDSAEVSARAHDHATQTPEEVPLLPRIYARDGRGAEAIALAADWRRRWRDASNVTGDALATLELSRLLLAVRMYEAAEREATEAVRLTRQANLPEERIAALVVRGRAQLGLRRARVAVGTLREAVALSSVGSTRSRAVAYSALGSALVALDPDSLSAALRAFEKGATAVEQLTRRFDADIDRARFHDAQFEVFDAAVAELLNHGQSLTGEAARIDRILDWEQRRKAVALGGGGLARSSLAAIQRSLGNDEALLDYVLLDTSAHAVVVRRTRAEVIPLTASGAQIGELVGRLRTPLATAYGGKIDVAHARYDLRLAARLYDLLLRQVIANHPDVRRLLISPDGALRLLPFDALVDSVGRGYADSRFLADRHLVTVMPIPGASAVVAGSGRHMLLVRGDVPGGVAEARQVAGAWRGRVDRLEGNAAAVSEMVRLAPHADVLHLATHALAAAQPGASKLELADGALRADVIERLPLRARLVVLSACETEAGPILRGAGPMSIARAFLAAGSQAVIATSWPVSGHAAEVMTALYGHMGAGVFADMALHQAKQSLRRNPATSHPFYWAGYVYIRR